MITLSRPPRLPVVARPGATLAAVTGAGAVLGGRAVLHDVTLTVGVGELVALVGPNGAGKSTLLAVLAGDVPAATGTVEIDGDRLGSYSPIELALRRAVLPQQVTVGFPFTVDDVVRMGRAPWARTPAAAGDDAAVDRAIADADIAHLVHRTFPTLSGGERARVALARALAQSTQLLLLDEPTAALDLHHQETILGVVRRRVDAGAGAVVVLHDLSLAAAYADRVVLLRGGAVVADGPPASVLRPDRLSDVYGHAVDVVPHPVTGDLLVVPARARS